jgi:exonuclease SbcD
MSPDQDALLKPTVIFRNQSDRPSYQGRKIKILHTSDWHLGRTLNKIRRRHEELEKFLDWLVLVIEQENIDVLLVSGDIFDNTAPSPAAQEQYYNFLTKVKNTACHNVVIISGNHDSASLLNAPAALLKAFKVFVVSDSTIYENQILTLTDNNNTPFLLVGAVPFLKDRDVRISREGESISDKDQSLINGIKNHYQTIAELLAQKQAQYGGKIPVIGMGHLFTSKGQVSPGDGVRDLYAGTLTQVEAESFSPVFDYLALGHLHRPQKAGQETIRYSGSPIKMNFGEPGEKSVTIVTIGEGALEIKTQDIPVFQELLAIHGDKAEIIIKLMALKKENSLAWLEIIYQGQEIIGDLRKTFEEYLTDSQMEIVTLIDERRTQALMEQMANPVNLTELTYEAVFDRLLTEKEIPQEECQNLRLLFQKIVLSLHEEGLVTQN